MLGSPIALFVNRFFETTEPSRLAPKQWTEPCYAHPRSTHTHGKAKVPPALPPKAGDVCVCLCPESWNRPRFDLRWILPRPYPWEKMGKECWQETGAPRFTPRLVEVDRRRCIYKRPCWPISQTIQCSLLLGFFTHMHGTARTRIPHDLVWLQIKTLKPLFSGHIFRLSVNLDDEVFSNPHCLDKVFNRVFEITPIQN